MKELSAATLRIIDANINRTGEGLRVLEEYARLSLNDSVLSRRLKTLRHKLVNTGMALQQKLIDARDALEDVGSAMEVPGEDKSRDMSEMIIANARRVQESLRVLEELAKNPDTALNSEDYRRARFELYDIEKELLGRLARKDKAKKIAGLYVIIDTAWLKGRRPQDIARQAIGGGAGVIQLRCKEVPVRDFLSIAVNLRAVCSEKGVLFIVNDSLEVALASGADGLHVGLDDLPVKIARRLLPVSMLLGASVKTREQAEQAVGDGADYLGAGSVFVTSTKESSRIGLKGLAAVKKAVDVPVVAIGGINKDNIGSVMKTGVAAAAVISAVMGALDVSVAAGRLVNIIEEQKDAQS